MSFFDFEGSRVFYTREGSGDPIIFLPNATLTHKLWEYQVEHFRATHDVIAVDLPGFGESDSITPSLELWVRWLGRFIDELELAPAALVGNCMGSLTALHLAVRAPEKVSALVLINMVDHEVGMAGPMGRGGWVFGFPRLRPLVEWSVRHTPTRIALRHPYPHSQFGDNPFARTREYHEHAIRCFSDPATRVALVGLGYSDEQAVLPPAKELEHLPPTCWVWGKANRLLPYDVGRRQLEVLHPDEVHPLVGEGYAVAWETPSAINRIVETFLARHSRRTERDLAPARLALATAP